MSLKFILIKEKIGYDISDIVQKVTWSGRKNSPARSLELQLLDDPELGKENRPGIDVYSGNFLIFLENGEELFRGIVMKQTRTQERSIAITAYDDAIYLANNKGSFKYKKKTLTHVFLDVCKRFGISRGDAVGVKYKIPVLVDVNTTIYDLLCNALSQTYKATGERFFILSKKGQLFLVKRKEQISKFVLETGAEGSPYGNLTQYSYSKDISETRTRLKLISEKGKTKAEWADHDLEEKIGMMQDIQIPDDSIKKKKLKTMAVTMLEELKKPKESLTVTAFGISTVYTGTAVYIYIPEIGIGRTFYVDADSHTWDGDYHTMKLTLNFANDLESINEAGEVEIDRSAESSAEKTAQEAIKEAATVLKQKKAAEKKVITDGKTAEKAANSAEKALNSAKKANDSSKASAFVTTAQDEAKKAQEAYDQSKVDLAELKALLKLSQSSITTKADSAVQQAEMAAWRASNAATEAAQYL